MTEKNPNAGPPEDPSDAPEKADGNTIRPLPGEAGIPNVGRKQPITVSRKNVVVIGVVFLAIAGAAVAVMNQYFGGSGDADKDSSLMRDRPSAAGAGTRPLDMTRPATPHVPAIIPGAGETVAPIGLRQPPPTNGPKTPSPDDAPVLVVSSRAGSPQAVSTDGSQPPNDPASATSRQLQDYQRRLQGMLDNLTQGNGLVNGQMPSAPDSTPDIRQNLQAAATGLFGGQLQGSDTPKVKATTLGDRSLTLPKGTAFTCALKTRVISATSGLVGCQVQRDVYSDNGLVLLIERGSHLDGEYRIASVRPGTVRIPVLWTRIRTPHGVTVDIESPGTGQLGESGIDGHVDKRWGDRIGAAMLLSLIDDSVKLVIQNQMQDREADTIVLPSTTENTSKLAEKVLDSTINIPPLVYQNQGGIVGIYVARDVDFSSVYALQPVER